MNRARRSCGRVGWLRFETNASRTRSSAPFVRSVSRSRRPPLPPSPFPSFRSIRLRVRPSPPAVAAASFAVLGVLSTLLPFVLAGFSFSPAALFAAAFGGVSANAPTRSSTNFLLLCPTAVRTPRIVPRSLRSGACEVYSNAFPVSSTGWNPTRPVPRTSSTWPSSSVISQCRLTTCTGSSADSLVMATLYEYTKVPSLGEDISGTSALCTTTRTPSVTVSLVGTAAMDSRSSTRRRRSAFATTASSRRRPTSSASRRASNTAPARNSLPMSRSTAARAPRAREVL